jgi:hypothetical protein
MNDPDFGKLVFMYISNHPEQSYWECEWKFPPTGTMVAIALNGDESGPLPEFCQWHLNLINRYPETLNLARPKLAEVFKSFFNQDLPSDIFTVVKLSGFGVEDPQAVPVKWDISFETIGDKWLGITIPFVGDIPEQVIVDI